MTKHNTFIVAILTILGIAAGMAVLVWMALKNPEIRRKSPGTVSGEIPTAHTRSTEADTLRMLGHINTVHALNTLNEEVRLGIIEPESSDEAEVK